MGRGSDWLGMFQGLAPVPPAAASGTNEQEIPDNVTAELEKLEQETGMMSIFRFLWTLWEICGSFGVSGTMAELQGVSEILGGLGDDDDELLAEMGADFNILEYADPELEALAGEKTNILDLHLEDDNLKQEKKREQLQRQQQQQQQQQQVRSNLWDILTTVDWDLRFNLTKKSLFFFRI